MTLSRAEGTTADRTFAEFPSLLRRGDLLVLNDTKVLRGRLVGSRAGGGAVEVFLLSRTGVNGETQERWEALARPSKRLKEGEELLFGGLLRVRLDRREGDGRWEAVLSAGATPVADAIARVGEVPLPPYIRRRPGDPGGAEDARRYQTVYAACDGSVAAPTAGLHFDRRMLREISDGGIGIARLTLSVGYGTFSPIRTEEVERYEIHPEAYRLPPEAAEAVNVARSRGGRVIAVGTTSVRTLESCATQDGAVTPSEGVTRLFLYPGRPFRVVDAMLTNFHLPRSSLLALVMAFAGVDEVKAAYREAVARRYRFFSYGDAMFIS
jgi:S-adenosylmethionine:tRNA ribosyltransferase-isomerase